MEIPEKKSFILACDRKPTNKKGNCVLDYLFHNFKFFALSQVMWYRFFIISTHLHFTKKKRKVKEKTPSQETHFLQEKKFLFSLKSFLNDFKIILRVKKKI